jgi:hypothetical protein
MGCLKFVYKFAVINVNVSNPCQALGGGAPGTVVLEAWWLAWRSVESVEIQGKSTGLRRRESILVFQGSYEY